jgi:hypothetical protein
MECDCLEHQHHRHRHDVRDAVGIDTRALRADLQQFARSQVANQSAIGREEFVIRQLG